jgi:hypothetical protein
MVLPFFSPLLYFSWIAGPEEAKNPSGGDVLRLIQIRLDIKFKKSLNL